MTYARFDALKQYRQTGVAGNVEEASPHKLIAMLLEGAIERIGRARTAMAAKDVTTKGRLIGEVIDIVGGLHGSLNMEAGGELATRLATLYDYMSLQLVKANLHNDPKLLDEVTGLIREISGAWNAMPDQYKKQQQAGMAGASP
ncbi:MAG: flagellar export chaperone FliS [Gammaproteobacteria bacterium]|nr:flagellar export chaperone FliS [Gammaproteobacteria bacterium]